MGINQVTLTLEGFNLEKEGGTLFQKDINLHVTQGENILIYGPSGTGKTTIYEALSYLTPPTQGKVFWDKNEITSVHEANSLRHKYISLIFSNFNFISHLSVEDNIILPAAASNQPNIKERLGRLMETFEFEDGSNKKENMLSLRNLMYEKGSNKKRNIHELSNGQKEIVSMARALMLDTPFILADEMLRSFPDKTKEVLWERFYDFTLSDEKPKGLIFITHWEPMLSLMPEPKILEIENQILTTKEL